MRDEVVLLSAGMATELYEKLVAWRENSVGLVLLCTKRVEKRQNVRIVMMISEELVLGGTRDEII